MELQVTMASSSFYMGILREVMELQVTMAYNASFIRDAAGTSVPSRLWPVLGKDATMVGSEVLRCFFISCPSPYWSFLSGSAARKIKNKRRTHTHTYIYIYIDAHTYVHIYTSVQNHHHQQRKSKSRKVKGHNDISSPRKVKRSRSKVT